MHGGGLTAEIWGHNEDSGNNLHVFIVIKSVGRSVSTIEGFTPRDDLKLFMW